MKVRVVYQPNGKVAVIHAAPNSRRKGERVAKWLRRVFDKAMRGELAGLPYDDIDSKDLPQDRKCRNKWRGEKGKPIWIEAGP